MKSSHIIKAFVFLILIITIAFSQHIFDISSFFKPDKIQHWLSSAGIFAPLFYMLLMASAVLVSPIPSLPLDIAAGAFFGPFLGTVYSAFGALTGAVLSFLIARILGRQFIEGLLGRRLNFCRECSDKTLTKIVFISRLLPVISFDVISYGAGLTKMSLKNFSLATFFGMIPLTFIYNYFGSVLVFGEGLTVALGLLMVMLFFLGPALLERTTFLKGIKHGAEEDQK